jgi:hypothetical protein
MFYDVDTKGLNCKRLQICNVWKTDRIKAIKISITPILRDCTEKH